jgi:hypothetical protein
VPEWPKGHASKACEECTSSTRNAGYLFNAERGLYQSQHWEATAEGGVSVFNVTGGFRLGEHDALKVSTGTQAVHVVLPESGVAIVYANPGLASGLKPLGNIVESFWL